LESFYPPLFTFGLYCAAAAIALRTPAAMAPALVVCATGAGVYLAGLFIYPVISPVFYPGAGGELDFWRYSSLYWFLALCFIIGFGLVYKSVSIRVLSHLERRPGHSMPRKELAEDFLHSQMFSNRFKVLVATGWMEESGEGLVLTESGRRLAGRIQMIQNAFRIHQSG